MTFVIKLRTISIELMIGDCVVVGGGRAVAWDNDDGTLNKRKVWSLSHVAFKPNNQCELSHIVLLEVFSIVIDVNSAIFRRKELH